MKIKRIIVTDHATILISPNPDEVFGRDRCEIVEKLQDSRLREIGTRVIYEERPDLLPKDTVSRLDLHIRQRFAEFDEPPWMTRRNAEAELNSLKAETEDQVLLKQAIANWLNRVD